MIEQHFVEEGSRFVCKLGELNDFLSDGADAVTEIFA